MKLDGRAYFNPGELADILRLERLAFAAKIRVSRAALGWSQSELAQRAGLTQRSVHKLEQGETDARRTTIRSIELVWREQGVEFEDLADGGFRVSIRAKLLDASAQTSPGDSSGSDHRKGAAPASHSRVHRA